MSSISTLSRVRAVNRRTSTVLFWLVTVASLALLAFFASVEMARFKLAGLLHAEARPIEATVIRKICSQHSGVEYRFAVSGKTYTVIGHACDTPCESMIVGTKESIVYAASRPEAIACSSGLWGANEPSLFQLALRFLLGLAMAIYVIRRAAMALLHTADPTDASDA